MNTKLTLRLDDQLITKAKRSKPTKKMAAMVAKLTAPSGSSTVLSIRIATAMAAK